MITRLVSKQLKHQVRTFIARWPPVKGSKLVASVDEAVADIKAGKSIMIGGYGKLGAPFTLIDALSKTSAKNLTVYTSIAACEEKGSSIQSLIEKGMISRLVTANIGKNQKALDAFKKGSLAIDLLPIGTFAEKVRAGGMGIPAFYSHIGCGTFHEEGGIPTQLSKDGKVIIGVSESKEKRMFNHKDYLLEKSYLADYAFVKAHVADTKGNCILKLAHRNFNPDMAAAGKICIVEADEIVEPGKLDGDDVHIASIFVHRVVQSSGSVCELARPKSCTIGGACDPFGGDKSAAKEMMVRRAAKEIACGNYVVLGKGLPKAVEDYVPKDLNISFVCPETGIFGAVKLQAGQDPICGLSDGCLMPVGLRKNAAICKAADTFGGLRGGHMNVAIIEGYQVSQEGDLANIEKGDLALPSPGLAFDIACSPIDKVVLMPMTSNGKPNLLPHCTYRVSGRKCVSKLITDMCVFEFRNGDLTLTELAPGVTVDSVKASTPCKFKVAEGLKQMDA